MGMPRHYKKKYITLYTTYKIMNFWLVALKKFNEGREKYLIPKKGSPEYEEVKNIQTKIQGCVKGNQISTNSSTGI